jgi:hypothetical protein
MPTLPDVLRVHSASRDSFNSWLRRGRFSSQYAESSAGIARPLNRDNGIEVGLFAAFSRANIDLNSASAYARHLLELEHSAAMPAFVSINPVTREMMPFSAADIGPGLFSGPMAGEDEGGGHEDPQRSDAAVAATELIIVNVAEIVRRVDALFAGEGEAS